MNRLALQVASISVLGIATAASAEIVTRVAILTGSQEVPVNASPARGGARIVIDTDANTATFEIVHWGLATAETAAHFHGMSAPGVNSGVVFALPSGTVKRGTWNFAEAQQAPLLNGLMYINVHSMAFPGGEIRGQIVAAVADLDGIQEVPSNGSAGGGVGLFNIDPTTDQLSYYIIYGGLGSPETAAHIHGYARHGVSAGVVHPLPAANPKVGVWNYPAAQEQAILDGLTYVNIHTTGFPGGEIRGQIVTWVNPICGLQEVPPTPSTGGGVTLAALERSTNTLTTDSRYGALVAAETAAHIHGFADPGVNAGVLMALPAGTRKFATWAFGAAAFNNVFMSRSYVNIHSAAFGGGEIRGQLFRGTSIPCAPLITDNPDSATVAPPAALSLMVIADTRGGGPLQYQWKRNGVNVPAAPPFFGSLTDTLTINPTAPILSGLYTCEVTNLCGPTLSSAANVVIEPPCDGDVNCDFALDGFDVEVQEKAVGGDMTDYCQPDPDFNGDFALDGFDVEAVEVVVGGGPCP